MKQQAKDNRVTSKENGVVRGRVVSKEFVQREEKHWVVSKGDETAS